MQLRTDLAIECNENREEIQGIEIEEEEIKGLKVSRMKVNSEKASKEIGKPAGKYITVEGLPLTDNFRDVREETETVAEEIKRLLPKENGSVLVIGIGNPQITPDALGSRSTKYILATRHIIGEISRSAGLDGLRSVSVIAPGVIGQTGIESGEIVTSLAKSLHPSAVVAIDALSARSLSRLGCTVQISDTGIAPGSGVGNHRMRLDKNTIGVPVIGIGVPTVVDAVTLACDLIPNGHSEIEKRVSPRGERMIVTPREIDLLIERAAKIVGMAVNCAVQQETDFETLWELVS